MACFLVPASEAVVTTVVEHVVRSKEKKTPDVKNDVPRIQLSEKLGWLNKMLWGGSALLAFEHIWHGEVIPTFPFLTAVKEGEVGGMLAEMGTAGVTMAVLVTAAWVGMVIVSNVIEKRQAENTDSKEVKA